ncbi:hypothetical protein NUV26_02020 [Burkholderia pseudomultivorans]|uniref:hypothetical protein n=1 Tax=Burkholderia pseudomultivorans TaxID=1207504 RepID=UPI00142891F7|nr:hypothetical protein [Burkholderia pseudomultivorans]MDS0790914.1 hypothetical protein [Burkholderia pseudomultivorans]
MSDVMMERPARVTRRDRLVRHPALFFVAIRAVKQSRRISKAENIGSGRPGGLR